MSTDKVEGGVKETKRAAYDQDKLNEKALDDLIESYINVAADDDLSLAEYGLAKHITCTAIKATLQKEGTTDFNIVLIFG